MHKTLILIVDDDREAIQAFGPMLTSQGFEARSAFDAQTAFQEIARQIPAAILLDLHLPVIDGVQFLRQLRSDCRLASIPVALVTGDYLIDDRISDELQRLGSRLHFKPLWEEDVIQIVRDLLDSCASTSTERDLSDQIGRNGDHRHETACATVAGASRIRCCHTAKERKALQPRGEQE